ncbi:DUF4998 domain-containing protein [Parapedobacter sp. 10938]|uniref:DUF4998 domain-containing protein n=1 Tax=Parapedobacter flavus TaxID=3110225 RepID=UPI002DBF329A|nr:DUF4998 domain-containing protein [Parapedobacter sp. 10938]MEC3878150.1 DUF4998 domain-containing protein [Parapedobacter sp. 10938]
MKRKLLFGCLPVILMAALFVSCIKQDAYKKFLEGGEISYAGRADSVIAQSGNGRIQLSIVLGNDPNVNKAMAFWNDRRDSAEIQIPESIKGDTVRMIIENLAEGTHNFVVYTFDNRNNSSVAVNVSGEVYGENYVSSLSNRQLGEIDYSTDGKLQLHWESSSPNEVYTEVHYQDQNEEHHSLTVSPEETLTQIEDYYEGAEIRYLSFFKPDSTVFELFAPEMTTVEIPTFERLLDKAGFRDFSLPTDVKDGGYGWLVEYLWNENYNPPGFATQSGIPQWFTLDLGVSTSLSKFKIWQANDRLYEKESVKKFEVWGSDNPDMDGSWDSWTKLMTCESVKPSGLPVGELSSEDIEYAKAGEEFVFPAGTPKTRYLRFKLLENWGNSRFMTIAELSFWTSDR